MTALFVVAALIVFVGVGLIWAGIEENRASRRLDARIAARYRRPASTRSWL